MTLSDQLMQKILDDDYDSVKNLILGGADVNFPDKEGISPLMKSVLAGNRKTLLLLLSEGANPNYMNYILGASALVIAVKTNKHDLMELLLKYGADVKQSDNNGVSPIWHAAFQGDLESVSLLVEYGCPIDLRDKSLRTPLILASYRGFLPVAAFLVSSGADINEKDNISGTPLSWACFGGHPQMVRYFLALGADTGVKNIEGKSILALARERENNEEVIRILLEAGITC